MVKPSRRATSIAVDERSEGHQEAHGFSRSRRVFTRPPWVRTPQQVVESLFRISRPTPEDAPVPPRPENKRVWASLLKGKNAVIQEVADEMERRDPSASKTRVALTDGERALQIRVDRKLKVTLILDLMHALEKLWKAAYVFHAEGSLEADLWVLDRTLRILARRCRAVGRQGDSSKYHQTRPVRRRGQNATGSRRLPLPKPHPHAL